GEYYWAPAYRETISGHDSAGWTRGWNKRIPNDVIVTCTNFVHSPSEFDCSADDSFRITLPSEPVASGMRLRWNGVEGHYSDPDGRLAAFDPSVFEPGPRALLVRQEAFMKYLAENGLELFWTVLGEKQLVGGWSRNESGWLQVSGAYRLTAGGIV